MLLPLSSPNLTPSSSVRAGGEKAISADAKAGPAKANLDIRIKSEPEAEGATTPRSDGR